jgi:hypothetical protein
MTHWLYPEIVFNTDLCRHLAPAVLEFTVAQTRDQAWTWTR